MNDRMPGLYYRRNFISSTEKREILAFVERLHPIWEYRYSHHTHDVTQRKLLRPVYWLGAWQFACLNYYRPSHGVKNRCVEADPFPRVLAGLISKVERLTRTLFPSKELPKGWSLNTCLINLYGIRRERERRWDTARVGEHKDFEPGPVASMSFGERALFQFVNSNRRGERSRVIHQQWLEDSSLQIFGGKFWKNRLFHRVQRVEKKNHVCFSVAVKNFETRRINFTFRFIPKHDIVKYRELPLQERADVETYVKELAKHSPFFAKEFTILDRN